MTLTQFVAITYLVLMRNTNYFQHQLFILIIIKCKENIGRKFR